MVGHLPGGLAQVNVVTNLIFSGMSGSAVADASGPGLVLARMMAKEGRYPPGFAAATSVVSATLGPLMPTSIPMIFYALIANASVGAMFLGGLVPAGLMAASMMVRDCADRRAAAIFRAKNACAGRRLFRFSAARCCRLRCPECLLGLIYSGVTTPTEAAAIAASYALAAGA